MIQERPGILCDLVTRLQMLLSENGAQCSIVHGAHALVEPQHSVVPLSNWLRLDQLDGRRRRLVAVGHEVRQPALKDY